MAKKRASRTEEGGGTAVLDAPKRGRKPKQPMLNDDPAFQGIEELEGLAESLKEKRTKRKAILADEVEIQAEAAKVMRKHKLTSYKSRVGLMMLEHLETDKVKIKAPEEPAASDD